MSMCRCEECDALIDSDWDMDCFIDIADGLTIILCERCREETEMKHEKENA